MADPQAVAATRLRDAYQRTGYVAAIMDVNRWAIDACDRPGMDSNTIMALMAEMARLTTAQVESFPAARQIGELTQHIIRELATQQNPAQPVSEPRDCDGAGNNQERSADGLTADSAMSLRTAGGSPGPSADGGGA